jgi:hypothetical protein
MSHPHAIVRHWSHLSDAVHPSDAPVFYANKHSFNLEFPPPAFIGDIINAPVILLDANGGFDPIVTPNEFRVRTRSGIIART